MVTCPFCETNCSREHLSEGFILCGRLKFAYRVDADGHVIEWCTTSKSHPAGFNSERSAPIARLQKSQSE